MVRYMFWRPWITRKEIAAGLRGVCTTSEGTGSPEQASLEPGFVQTSGPLNCAETRGFGGGESN